MALAGIDTGEEELAYPPEAVRMELARILESTEFSATPRRRKLLEYLVEEMLAGRGGTIKGYTIGVNVLGRGEDFDPDSDPIVRQEARSLRRDLDGYYVEAGRDDPLRIAIPKGHYVPKITCQQAETGEESIAASYSLLGNHRAAPTKRRYWLVGGILAAIAIAASGTWIWQNLTGNDVATVSPPTIAVLPFEVLSSSKQDRFLGAGISSQIVADLNRFPDIRIYMPQAGFTENSSISPIELGERLGVSYVVAGELRTYPSSIDVAARLFDAKSGEVLWTDTYERELASQNLMAIQRDIAAGVASTLGQSYGVIRSQITKNLPAHALPSMSSYECVLRGYDFRRTYSPSLYPSTLACVEQAVRVDPSYAEAWAMLGFLHFTSTALSILPTDPEKNYRTGAEAALRSIEIDPENVLGLKVLSVINHYQGNYAESERYVRRALEINPNDPDTLYSLAFRLVIRGKFDEGIPLLQRAIDRTVNPPPPYFHLMAIDRLMKKDGKGMLDFAQRATVDGSAISQSLVAMAYGLLGNWKAQQRAIKRMNEINPGYDPIARFRVHQATDEITAAMQVALHQKSE